jgi:hypothetical protein
MLHYQSPPSSVSQKFQKINPLQVPQWGPLWRELPVSRGFFYMSLKFFIKVLLIKEILPSSRRPSERNVPCSPRRCPYANRHPFPENYFLAYTLGSPVKEPSFQVLLIKLPQTEKLHFQSPPSFIFQSLW